MNLFRLVPILLLLAVVSVGRLRAQVDTTEIEDTTVSRDTTPVVTGRLGGLRPIIVGIEIEGNQGLSSDQISSVLNTRASSTPYIQRQQRLLSRFFFNTDIAAPKTRLAIEAMLRTVQGELHYLDPRTLAADTSNLRALYNNYGFHDMKVEITTRYDTASRGVVVHYGIQEGAQYPLRGVAHLGLEVLPPSVREYVHSGQLYELGEPFNQDLLTEDNDRIVVALRDSGYPFAVWSPLQMIVLNARPPIAGAPFDSALVLFYPDQRYRFGNTIIQGDSGDRQPVHPDVLLDQREYEAGEWYSRRAIDLTLQNIYGLGVFDLVSIDTVGVQPGDSTIDMRIRTRLRPLNELELAPEYGYEIRSILADVHTVGGSASYRRLNLFGGAEQFTVGARFMYPFSDEPIRYGFSASYLNPDVPNFPLFGTRKLRWEFGGSFDRNIFDRLPSKVAGEPDIVLMQTAVGVQSGWRWRLDKNPLNVENVIKFNAAEARIRFQYTKYENVRNYIDRFSDTITRRVIGDLRSEGGSIQINTDTAIAAVRRSLINDFLRLTVLQGDDISLLAEAPTDPNAQRAFNALKQTYVFGGSLIGDNRNDLLAPTRGHYHTFGLDIGLSGLFGFSGLPQGRFIGVFFKPDVSLRYYGFLRDRASAARVHFGFIKEIGQFPLTPNTLRYRAGGANSNRGWNIGELIATRRTNVGNTPLDTVLARVYSYTQQLFGGLAILEINLEARFQPFHFDDKSSFSWLNDFLVIPFIDAGNAFFNSSEEVKAVTWRYLYSNIGTAVGLSVGYASPIGPIRLGFGFPVYDPTLPATTPASDRWIINREFMPTLVFHFGIGHAF